MQIIKTIAGVRDFISTKKGQKRIGYVPTMGALHLGHMQLIDSARLESEIVVCSIFVNPTQFNKAKDLENYPVDLANDIKKLEDAGCDMLFIPEVNDMYPYQAGIKFIFKQYDTLLEGAFRPGHFSGVGLVVSKFFNIIQPDTAYFGQKDLQQYFIIKQLQLDLFFPVSIKLVPTVRESDGLAMSSRNRLLSDQERKDAVKFYQALQLGAQLIEEHQDLNKVRDRIHHHFDRDTTVSLEYFEIVSFHTFTPIKTYHGEPIALCISGYVGSTRLIDNIVLGENNHPTINKLYASPSQVS